MKKVYLLEDLDCAHCAALIEEAVGKLDGVSKSSLAFLTQKLTIEVEEMTLPSRITSSTRMGSMELLRGCRR